MNANDLLGKANRALRSAKTLQADGDFEGACNRAYYAMFDAARAALLIVEAGVPEEIAKPITVWRELFRCILSKKINSQLIWEKHSNRLKVFA